MLGGVCDIEFSRGQQTQTLHQRGPAAYAFAGGYRWEALHAVREVEGERHVVLVRLDLPGRIGLVPMFQNVNQFAGYRRLDATTVGYQNYYGTHCIKDWWYIDRAFP